MYPLNLNTRYKIIDKAKDAYSILYKIYLTFDGKVPKRIINSAYDDCINAPVYIKSILDVNYLAECESLYEYPDDLLGELDIILTNNFNIFLIEKILQNKKLVEMRN